MPFEQISPPMSGAMFLAVAGYAVFSFYGSGPMLGGRIIERSDWVPRCEKTIVQSVRRDTPKLQSPPPSVDCNSVMSIFAGNDGKALCDVAGVLFENPLTSQIENQNRKLVEAYNNRVAHAAASASSRCTCSVNVVLKNRVPFALLAGSLRLIEVAEVRNLDARLTAALSSPVCTGRFK